MDDVKAQARDFLGQFIGPRRPEHDEEDIFGRGLVNSLFAMQLIAWVEQTFAVKVEDEDLEITNFYSVSAIAGFVARKRQPGAASAPVPPPIAATSAPAASARAAAAGA